MNLSQSTHTADVARKLIDWYWRDGHKRQDQYELSTGGWLDRLYTAAQAEQRLAQAEGMGKAAIGLWGPSQTGKSTSLAYSIDKGAAEDGTNSALDWGVPARFSGEIRDGGPAVLNPFNGGQDGSGCISEFRLATEVASPNFPIELVLSTPSQLMHALAVGFATECRPEKGDHKVISWDVHALDELLDEFGTHAKVGNVTADIEIRRGNYDFLRSVVDILEMLRMGDEERYMPLSLEELPLLRKRILQSPGLLLGEENARRFAARLFWNDAEPFNRLYKDLCGKLREIRASFGPGAKALASIRAAALFLDIASFDKLQGRKNPVEKARLRQLVSRLGYSRSANGATILIGEDEGSKLLPNDKDLALFQGIILKLIVPLKEAHLRSHAPALCQLLEQANLLDFPGVSGEGKRAEEHLLRPESLMEPNNEGEIYSRVLKRGKTGSIVASTARQFDIDSFCLLVRGEGHPGSPYQLVNGINAWWRSLTGESIHTAKSRVLPMSLVLTRWQNLTSIAQANPSALPEAFGIFGTLGILVDPKVVSILGANTPTYGIEPLSTQGDETKRKQVTETLKNSALFCEKFREHLNCIDEIFGSPDGGCGYLFKHLTHTLGMSPRTKMLTRLHVENNDKLQDLFREASPGADEPRARRDRVLRAWKEGIESSLAKTFAERADEQGNERLDFRDPAQWVGYHLRCFLDVTAELLDPLPINVGQAAPFSVLNYLKKQLRSWSDAKQQYSALDVVGITDRQHSLLLLEYLVSGVPLNELQTWVRKTVEVRDHGAAFEWRAQLALRIARSLAPELAPTSLYAPVTQETFDKLDELDQREEAWDEDYRNSPHYHRAVKPVFDLIQRLNTLPVKGREPQEGDGEIVRLFAEYLPSPLN